jgi:UDP-glucuronate decarboxylase
MLHPIIAEDIRHIIETDLPWSEFGSRTVLVAGASGFLPAYMVETLLQLNRGLLSSAPLRVIGLVRDRDRARARFACYLNTGCLQILEHDVCDPLSIDGPVDFVIHAASQASPRFYGSDPVGTLSANVVGTRNLLELAREKKSSGFLFFSSGDVYGNVSPAQIPTREDVFGMLDPTDVRSCYGESKRIGETMCACWAHQHGVPAKIVRPFHTYGPGMRLDDGRVFADFVADILHGRDIALNSDGSAIRAFCYLSDATAGYFTVMLKGAVGQAYNVGNDNAESSIRELAQILIGLNPEKNLRVVHTNEAKTVGYLRSAVSRTCPDTTKVRRLGWAPVVTIAEGFRRTIETYA